MKTLATAAVLALLGTSSAVAATGTMIFNATVLDVCVVTIGTPGTMNPNSEYTELSSKNSGTASSATILTTGSSFDVSAIAPAAFIPAQAVGSSFAATYSLSGDTTAAETAGATTTALNAGTTTISADLTATRSSGSYGTGAYVANVTVLCE